MKNIFNNISPVREFSYFILAMTIFGIVFLSMFHKGDIVLSINTISNSKMDIFFRNYTILGLGMVMAIMAVVFLFINYYYSILSIAGLILAGIFTFLFKHVIFLHMPRPTKYFEHSNALRLIEGVHFHSWCSFPSGHSMTAFACATIIVLATKNKSIAIVAFILASLVAFSRMYLLQHFFMDVYAGGLIGFTYTILLNQVLKQYKTCLNQNLLITLSNRQQKKARLRSSNSLEVN